MTALSVLNLLHLYKVYLEVRDYPKMHTVNRLLSPDLQGSLYFLLHCVSIFTLWQAFMFFLSNSKLEMRQNPIQAHRWEVKGLSEVSKLWSWRSKDGNAMNRSQMVIIRFLFSNCECPGYFFFQRLLISQLSTWGSARQFQFTLLGTIPWRKH